MAHRALELIELSKIAVMVGINQGFNAAGVEHWIDTDTMEARLSFTFGDHVVMLKPRLRMPGSWALSYDLESPCSRELRTIELPKDVIYEPAHVIAQKLTESLLELKAEQPQVQADAHTATA